jgi:hypothetical protein
LQRERLKSAHNVLAQMRERAAGLAEMQRNAHMTIIDDTHNKHTDTTSELTQIIDTLTQRTTTAQKV